MLWRLSPQGLSVFRPGEQGAGVRWLTKSLITAGIENLQVQDLYGVDVIEAVKTFQRKRGLVADGVAGRQTLIHLNSATDKTIPRLSSPGEG
jgi:murein L,D-transpeptidase YcbB/YkuD